MKRSELLDTLLWLVWDETELIMVDVESDHPKPDNYPYVARKITSPWSSSSESERYEEAEGGVKVVVTSQPTLTLSLTVYSDKKDDALDSADELLKALKRNYMQLSERGIVLANFEPMTDRTVFGDITYEHRIGFDIQIRIEDEYSYTVEAIDTVISNEEAIGE
ncbi:hypothetical protein [Geomicrobium sp. JCM 19055]|uniref:phage neck terminator protein n=1 Tax=Geomicrobium sp. JCM 19055 TaxID=1460649 RepID=UPI00045ECD8B|nr:hypothetical protein [Geomicrobium sp. JCM 19055]GAK01506.1 hypothetical protein JCM19055_4678 [Geomicrobium sp. JCM 19055]